MEVMDGMLVRLYTEDGREIELLPCKPKFDFSTSTVFRHIRSGISIEPGTPFTIKIELDAKRFRRYFADGIQSTTAIGHLQQVPGTLNDVQAQFIPVARGWSGQLAVKNMIHWASKNHPPTPHPLRAPPYERKPAR